MCGILLVKGAKSIPLNQHLAALSLLDSRGPDFSRYRYHNGIFIGQTVLHVTGSNDYYHHDHTDFLSYNGEIYNYRDLGHYSNDIEFVHDCVINCIDRINLGWGPWAWAWTDGNQVLYATDPQGERSLYQYQDSDILIVCSEIAPVLEYIASVKIDVPYVNKTWTMLDQTPWSGIVKITPGKLYQNGQAVKTIDSIWSWITQSIHHNIDEVYEDFRDQWQKVTRVMTPTCVSALTYSGGLDSNIILSHIPELELYAVNNLGKDPIVDGITQFLDDQEQSRLHELKIDPAQWAQELQQLIARTRLPALSWSFVGQWLATKHCEQRVLFTGAGADELFGGYDIYRNLEYCRDGSTSPYSRCGDPTIWQQCLSVYDNDPKQATLLMDYWYQVVGCDARAIDLIAGAYGIEPRNPFLTRPIMQLALNLPIQFKIGTVSKPLIRRLFLERWRSELISPKKGFTGHANDALPWLPFAIASTGDRMADWRQIARKSFYESK
jgi:asparagine synthetase B (glutamine-hydrolysing)